MSVYPREEKTPFVFHHSRQPTSHTLGGYMYCWCMAQVEAGADILQVFEAMGGFISEDHFYDRAMPYLTR